MDSFWASLRFGSSLQAPLTRASALALMALILSGSTPVSEDSASHEGPRLVWISIASRPAASDEIGVSVLLMDETQADWTLEARTSGPHPRLANATFRQRISDRELSYFPLTASEADTLVIQLQRKGDEVAGSLVVPLDSVKGRTLLIPEWSPKNTPIPAEDWVLLPIQLAESAAVRFAVYDHLGRQVCTWPDTYLSAGPITVLWDKRDQTGVPVANGTYHLVLTGKNVVGG